MRFIAPAAGLLAFLALPAFAAPLAVLQGTIIDALTGKPAACTVAITDANGKILVENDSFHSGFRCSGQFTKQLTPGRVRIRITRGFETKAIEQELNLAAGEERSLNFRLERVVDLRRRGWYAGDSHVHMLHGERTVPVTFDFVALTARAEDLQYLSLAQAWTLEHPTPEALEAQLRPRSTPDCVLAWNLEAPKNYYKGDAGRCLGHCWNVGVRGRTREGLDVIRVLLDASAWDYESEKPSYANFESHQLIHAQGGAVFYTHPARWWTGAWGGQGGYPKREQMRVSNMAVELPLDTVIGPTFDGLDVVTGPGEYEANQQAFALWALLLNHGYRLAATGSADACFDRPGGGVPGTPRTYTFVPGRFSLAKVARATAGGHTFVTTGPLLIATMDGAPPGSVFSGDSKDHVLKVEAWASGNDDGGLNRLELLRNGQPFRNISFEPGLNFIRTNLVLREAETAWYCVRAFGGNERKQVAITSAFYFADRNYHPPQPARAQVRAQIVDARSGERLTGTIMEVTFEGTIPRPGKRHTARNGECGFSVPGTVRLLAEASGYKPQTLSPFLDNAALVEFITNLPAEDLLKWETFERVGTLLNNVELTFRLQRL